MTIFCDIDGTIFKYRKFDEMQTTVPIVIETTVKKLQEWYDNGDHIVLTTARPHDMRFFTLMELVNNKIPYHQIIMGIERGPRMVINDMDPEKEGERALAMNLIRDKGI